MKFQEFSLERWLPGLSAEINLAGALCLPLSYRDVIEDFDLDQQVTYGSTQGSIRLREEVALLFPGRSISPAQVLITSGTAEANFLLLNSLIEPGDEFVLVTPTYMQTAGLAGGLGAAVKLVSLDESMDWQLNLAALEAAVSPKTKAILVTNPNNPTGSRLYEHELKAVCAIADRAGAYLIADEALRGLEADGVMSPSPVEFYDRGICTGSLSKIGLPGIRIGWIVAPPDIVESCWARKDYTTLAHGGFNEMLAEVALEPANYSRFRARAASIVREHSAIFMDWVKGQNGRLRCVEPLAGGSAFPYYQARLDSLVFCERAISQASLALSPGDYFGGPGHFRIRHCVPLPVLREGLRRLGSFLDGMPEPAPDKGGSMQ